jgi:hypothetical protein
MIRRLTIFLIVTLFVAYKASAAIQPSEDPASLKQVGRIDLPSSVSGNFDHLALDLRRNRLFVAAEDSKGVLVLDAGSGKLVTEIPVIRPHAILYRADTDRLFVTDGEDASLRIFDGEAYKQIKRVSLEKDADSIGYDPSRKLLYVVSGGKDAGRNVSDLSTVDTNLLEKVNDLKVDGDTLEAMSLDLYRPRLYLNNKAANEVVVIDRYTNAIVSHWHLDRCKDNVAMALDEQRQRLLVGCRSGQIEVIDSNTGKSLQDLIIHTGIDDLIFDPISRRIYATTDGYVDVFDETDLDHYVSRGSIKTGAKARTARYDAELHRLFVAVPKNTNTAAHVLVFEPENTMPPRTPPNDVKEAVHAPRAEEIVRAELSGHPTLRRMGLHVIPPGQSIMVLIANGNETRIGIHTSQSDFDAVKSGEIYGPRIEDGMFYNMKMILSDAQHREVGILVMEIPCTDADSEQQAAQKADQIRNEVSAQIPDLQSLFAP